MPSDTAVLDTEVRHAGGDPRRVHVVTIGFNGAQALGPAGSPRSPGFIPDDGVQLQVSGHPITAFALDRNGGPAYPGLVAFTTRRLIASRPGARARVRRGDGARATRTRWPTRRAAWTSCCARIRRCSRSSRARRCAPTCRCSPVARLVNLAVNPQGALRSLVAARPFRSGRCSRGTSRRCRVGCSPRA